ncbi:DUF3108 domain-containing protein [Photobacterium sagamiensis]|uniref:DUF3108 domain-containing protein n=1 Tax=Photobacterium sagamiensis TaxID=2910241 RepID=UPI003D0A6F3D
MKSLILCISVLLSSFSSLLYAALPAQYHQCNKTLTYNVYFHNHKIGMFERNLNWNDGNVDIYTYSKVDVLVTKSTLKQQSKVAWSSEKNTFLTQSFDRMISGIMAGNISAKFSDNGRRSSVLNDGKTLTFFDNNMPLLDGDAIGSQMRFHLINGDQAFDFMLQEADEVNHYYFAVKGQETINTNFGRVNTIRVEQIKKSDRKVVLWFAPSVDYQLVRATYKRKILDLKATLVRKKIQCPPAKPLTATTTTLSPSG